MRAQGAEVALTTSALVRLLRRAEDAGAAPQRGVPVGTVPLQLSAAATVLRGQIAALVGGPEPAST